MYGVDSVKESSSVCEEYRVHGLDSSQEGGEGIIWKVKAVRSKYRD